METLKRFGMAGTAGCGATLCVHPLDVIRVNLQVDGGKGGSGQYRGMLHCAQSVFAREGPTGLYAGLSAGIFRQVTYGMPRMAFYPMLVEQVKTPEETAATLPLWKKFLCGATAGGTASMFGVPSEVSLVRMAADTKLAANDPLRRNYSSVVDALRRTARDEGVGALWSGAGPTVARAILLNAGQLAVYSDAKIRINEKLGLEGIALQFSSSLVASAFATALCCPADVLKSRIQNAQPGQFASVLACATSVVKEEGVRALWKGYTPAMIKLAPHTVISFVILDNLSRAVLGRDAI